MENNKKNYKENGEERYIFTLKADAIVSDAAKSNRKKLEELNGMRDELLELYTRPIYRPSEEIYNDFLILEDEFDEVETLLARYQNRTSNGRAAKISNALNSASHSIHALEQILIVKAERKVTCLAKQILAKSQLPAN